MKFAACIEDVAADVIEACAYESEEGRFGLPLPKLNYYFGTTSRELHLTRLRVMRRIWKFSAVALGITTIGH
jgi:hypothetical protein